LGDQHLVSGYLKKETGHPAGHPAPLKRATDSFFGRRTFFLHNTLLSYFSSSFADLLFRVSVNCGPNGGGWWMVDGGWKNADGGWQMEKCGSQNVYNKM